MKPATNIPIGASAEKSIEVTRDLTVAHFHANMPEVYGTPMMIYLMEVTSSEAIQGYLPEGWVSVGVGVDIQHLAATPVGFTVTTKAEVIAVSDNTVTLKVEAYDDVEKIGEGMHVRAPIDMARFGKRVTEKTMKRKG
jgi:predicted thioesterase